MMAGGMKEPKCHFLPAGQAAQKRLKRIQDVEQTVLASKQVASAGSNEEWDRTQQPFRIKPSFLGCIVLEIL